VSARLRKTTYLVAALLGVLFVCLLWRASIAASQSVVLPALLVWFVAAVIVRWPVYANHLHLSPRWALLCAVVGTIASVPGATIVGVLLFPDALTNLYQSLVARGLPAAGFVRALAVLACPLILAALEVGGILLLSWVCRRRSRTLRARPLLALAGCAAPLLALFLLPSLKRSGPSGDATRLVASGHQATVLFIADEPWFVTWRAPVRIGPSTLIRFTLVTEGIVGDLRQRELRIVRQSEAHHEGATEVVHQVGVCRLNTESVGYCRIDIRRASQPDVRVTPGAIGTHRMRGVLGTSASFRFPEPLEKWRVEQLVAALEDSDDDARLVAAKSLVQAPSPRAVQPLISALRSANTNTRSSAALILGQIADARCVEPLVAALGADSDEGVRVRGAYALGQVGDPRAVEPLTAALRGGSERVRASAAAALGEFGGGKVVEALTGSLSDSSREVRERAAVALGMIGDEKAVKALVAAAATPSLQATARDALVLHSGELAVGPLVAALRDGDPPARREAADALGLIGDERALEPLIATLWDDDPVVSREAAEALGAIGDDRALEPLTSVLEDSESRQRVFEALWPRETAQHTTAEEAMANTARRALDRIRARQREAKP